MASESSCTAELLSMSTEAATRLIESSALASSGMALSYARSINLSLAIIAGMLCIYLGWRLYRDTILSKTSGDFSWGEFRVKLSAAGPGVFLVLFGAWLIVSVVSQRVEFKRSDEVKSTSSLSGGGFRAAVQPHRLPDELTLVASVSSKDLRCMITRKSSLGLSGYSGMEVMILGAKEIDVALGVAINSVKKEATGLLASSPLANVEPQARTVRVLEELRANVVRDDM